MADGDRAWLAGAVLTGGASRRMGRDKATLAVHGRPMAARVASALVGAGCAPVIAVGGEAAALRVTGLDVVPDDRRGVGPIGGVLGALTHFAGNRGVTHVAVVACDLPLLIAPALAPLVAAAGGTPTVDVVVATADGRLEPAVAIWAVAARDRVVALVDGGTWALHDVIGELRSVRVPVDAAPLLNVNRPGDVPAGGWRSAEYPGDS